MGDDSQELEDLESRNWSPYAQAVAAVLWPAFLAASLATVLFFAFIDPEALGDVVAPSLELSRMSGYAAGFFFFWLISTAASGLTAYLLHTSHRTDP